MKLCSRSRIVQESQVTFAFLNGKRKSANLLAKRVPFFVVLLHPMLNLNRVILNPWIKLQPGHPIGIVLVLEVSRFLQEEVLAANARILVWPGCVYLQCRLPAVRSDRAKLLLLGHRYVEEDGLAVCVAS